MTNLEGADGQWLFGVGTSLAVSSDIDQTRLRDCDFLSALLPKEHGLLVLGQSLSLM